MQSEPLPRILRQQSSSSRARSVPRPAKRYSILSLIVCKSIRSLSRSGLLDHTRKQGFSWVGFLSHCGFLAISFTCNRIDQLVIVLTETRGLVNDLSFRLGFCAC
jgi:hypothetical protein